MTNPPLFYSMSQPSTLLNKDSNPPKTFDLDRALSQELSRRNEQSPDAGIGVSGGQTLEKLSARGEIGIFEGNYLSTATSTSSYLEPEPYQESTFSRSPSSYRPSGETIDMTPRNQSTSSDTWEEQGSTSNIVAAASANSTVERGNQIDAAAQASSTTANPKPTPYNSPTAKEGSQEPSLLNLVASLKKEGELEDEEEEVLSRGVIERGKKVVGNKKKKPKTELGKMLKL